LPRDSSRASPCLDFYAFNDRFANPAPTTRQLGRRRPRGARDRIVPKTVSLAPLTQKGVAA
jgi:hypothetical protein